MFNGEIEGYNDEDILDEFAIELIATKVAHFFPNIALTRYLYNNV